MVSRSVSSIRVRRCQGVGGGEEEACDEWAAMGEVKGENRTQNYRRLAQALVLIPLKRS